MKPLICLLFTLQCFCPVAQSQQGQKGLLLLSAQRTANSFDLFFPLTYDSTKSLQANIRSATERPAFMIQVVDSTIQPYLSMAIPVRNEALGKGVKDSLDWMMVLPVEAIFETSKSAVFARNEKDSFLDWPVECYGKTLFESYNARLRKLTSIRPLLSPER